MSSFHTPSCCLHPYPPLFHHVAAGGRPQSSWLLPDSGLGPSGNPEGTPNASREVDPRPGDILGLGLQMLRSEAIPLSNFHKATANSHVAAAVWPSPVHKHTDACISRGSQRLGSLPSTAHKHTHTASHRAMVVCLSQTHDAHGTNTPGFLTRSQTCIFPCLRLRLTYSPHRCRHPVTPAPAEGHTPNILLTPTTAHTIASHKLRS